MATTPILVDVQYLGQPIYSREMVKPARVSRRELRSGMIVEEEVQAAQYRDVDTGERRFPQTRDGKLLPKWVDGKYQFRPESNYVLAITVDDARRLIARWPHLFKQITDLDVARSTQATVEDMETRNASLEAEIARLKTAKPKPARKGAKKAPAQTEDPTSGS